MHQYLKRLNAQAGFVSSLPLNEALESYSVTSLEFMTKANMASNPSDANAVITEDIRDSGQSRVLACVLCFSLCFHSLLLLANWSIFTPADLPVVAGQSSSALSVQLTQKRDVKPESTDKELKNKPNNKGIDVEQKQPLKVDIEALEIVSTTSKSLPKAPIPKKPVIPETVALAEESQTAKTQSTKPLHKDEAPIAASQMEEVVAQPEPANDPVVHKEALAGQEFNLSEGAELANEELSTEVNTLGVLTTARAKSTNRPQYPWMAIKRNQTGQVKVELDIDINGRATNFLVTQSSGYPLLDKSVLDFVTKERFHPAYSTQGPMPSRQLFAFKFVLNDA